MEHQRAPGARFNGDRAFQVELKFRNGGFEERGKPEKNPQNRDENHPHDVNSGNQTQATFVGGKRF